VAGVAVTRFGYAVVLAFAAGIAALAALLFRLLLSEGSDARRQEPAAITTS